MGFVKSIFDQPSAQNNLLIAVSSLFEQLKLSSWQTAISKVNVHRRAAGLEAKNLRQDDIPRCGAATK